MKGLIIAIVVNGAFAAHTLAYLPIYAGPSYAGFFNGGWGTQGLPSTPFKTAGNGVAICGAYGRPPNSPSIPESNTPFRISANQSPTQLDGLPLQPGAGMFAYAYAANAAGAVAGESYKVSATNNDIGSRAVRWSAGSATPTELASLGLGSTLYGNARAQGINTSETAVGWSEKAVGGNYQGVRAVRWAGGSTVATELGHLSLAPDFFPNAEAIAINDAGTAIGFSSKIDVAGNFLGDRPVRWATGSTNATELAVFSTDSAGVGNAYPSDINAAGTIVGHGTKMNPVANNPDFGPRAARWSAGGTTVTELGHLGLAVSGTTSSKAYDVNAHGVTVGVADKYFNGALLGSRAVRWDAASTVAVELANLGTFDDGGTSTTAVGISDTGIIAGTAMYVVGNVPQGDRAVIWLQNGSIVDLNDYVTPGSGWFLQSVSSISSTNWVVGTGIFQASSSLSYNRVFMMQVPEPTAALLIPLLLTRRRPHR